MLRSLRTFKGQDLNAFLGAGYVHMKTMNCIGGWRRSGQEPDGVRVAAQATLGYVFPLLGLYLKEIMERHEYARLHGLDVLDLRSTLGCELPTALRLVSKSVMAAAVCLWAF